MIEDFEKPPDCSNLLTQPQTRRKFHALCRRLRGDGHAQIADEIADIAKNLYRRVSALPVARARHGSPTREMIINVGREKYASVESGENISDRALSLRYRTSTRVISYIIAGRRDNKPIYQGMCPDGTIETIYKYTRDLQHRVWPVPPGCEDLFS